MDHSHLCSFHKFGKSDFWKKLNDIENLIDGPCCVGGDFNEILCHQIEMATQE